MRIGLFGGSFNPPHIGHLIVAETVRDRMELDRVLWIPAAAPPHKASAHMVSGGHRLAMTRLAIIGNPHFAASDIELRRSGPSYTIDTVRSLVGDAPGNSHFLIIGGDSYRAFHTWRAPKEIGELVPLIVYDRPDGGAAPERPDVPATVHHVEAPMLDISATNLRARLAAGRSVRYLVPDAVIQYIRENKLYGLTG
jgi:nicotinate-nucleotide adenylyltransferase